jgi:hypothetical protein
VGASCTAAAAMELSDMAADTLVVNESKPKEEEVADADLFFLEEEDDEEDGRRCFTEVNAAGNE